MTLASIVCLLNNCMQLLLSQEIKAIISESQRLKVKEEKHLFLEEFPLHLVLKVISRQAALFVNKSKCLPKNSTVFKIYFNQVILKKQKKIISIRADLEESFSLQLDEFLELSGAVVEDGYPIEVDVIFLNNEEKLVKLYEILSGKFTGFYLELLVEDLRFYSQVETKKGRIILPVSEEAHQFLTIENGTFLCPASRMEDLLLRVVHTHHECSKPCCVDVEGRPLSMSELRLAIAERMGIPYYNKKVSINKHHYFEERRQEQMVKDYLNKSQRKWKDSTVKGHNVGKEYRDLEEQTFRVLKKGPGEEDPQWKETTGKRTEREILLDMKKEKEKSIEVPFLGGHVLALGEESQTVKKALKYANPELDVDWLPVGRHLKEEDTSSSGLDNEEEEEDLEEETRLLLKDAQTPLDQLTVDLKLHTQALKRNHFSKGLMNIYKNFKEGRISSEGEFFGEVEELTRKMKNLYGADEQEEEGERDLTSDEGIKKRSSGSLQSRRSDDNDDFVWKMSKKVDELSPINRRRAKTLPLNASYAESSSSSDDNKDILNKRIDDRAPNERLELFEDEKDEAAGGLASWVPGLGAIKSWSRGASPNEMNEEKK